ncbi:GreA/GreB family elongation factor [Alkalilimnicola sp. S0819]|uniref:GreA/GreB family elongation factor n=1 Tax=Alkalilimnicola sp. S0819 TaxID=2613922 RepID=UPI00186A8D95|nr:GreA/GreB family elongation factor [Alkalilimnicola sp. S0819]
MLSAQTAQTQAQTLSIFDVQRLEPVLLREAGGHEQPEHVLELAARLYACDQAQPESIPTDVVTMNSRVRLEDMNSGRHIEITLVFPRLADSASGCISVLAPLGSALLGARVGQTVEAHTPAGERSYRIEALLYQPEADGRYDL